MLVLYVKLKIKSEGPVAFHLYFIFKIQSKTVKNADAHCSPVKRVFMPQNNFTPWIQYSRYRIRISVL